jgi:hypothetical protein
LPRMARRLACSVLLLVALAAGMLRGRAFVPINVTLAFFWAGAGVPTDAATEPNVIGCTSVVVETLQESRLLLLRRSDNIAV